MKISRLLICIFVLGNLMSSAVATVVDAPAPQTETGVAGEEFFWLDNDTLGVLHTKTGYQALDEQFTSFDLRTGRAAITNIRGQTICANDKEGLITILSRESQERKPLGVSIFQWNSNTKSLSEVELNTLPSWNPYICLYTSKEDQARQGFGDSGRRYLQRSDGVIQWKYSGSHDSEPVPLFLLKDKHQPRELAATSDDIDGSVQGTIRYSRFGDLYILSIGHLSSGYTIKRGQKVSEKLMITMTSDGTIQRTSLSAKLRDHLKSGQQEGLILFPTKAGNLVFASGDALRQGGVYLDSSSTTQRVWCVPPSGPQYGAAFNNRPCKIGHILLSPDGCKVALSSLESSLLTPGYKSSLPTIKILDVCGRQ